MTIIVAALSIVLGLGLATFDRDVAAVSDARMRAQTAADAAALAAAAESGPYGHQDPISQAREYAEANGGKLVACLCPVGGSAVQVTVAVGSTSAAARAVLDPTKLMGVDAAFDGHGMNHQLAQAVVKLLSAAHGRVTFVSGYRSASEQQQLWDDAIAKYGDPEIADNWVARPGNSMHERGLAVDLGGDLDLAVHLVSSLDLPMWRPLPNEPWHFELVGSRG